MKKLFSLFLLILLIGACSNPFARKPFTAEDQKKIDSLKREIQSNPKDDLNLMILGTTYLEKNYIDESYEYLTKAVELNPNNYEAMAWLGVCSTKRGRELSGWYCFGLNKIRAVKKGVAYLNEAVEKSPDNPVIRLARIGTILTLKGKFSDFTTVQKDLNYFKSNLEKPGFYTEEIKLHILYYIQSHQLVLLEMKQDPDSQKKETIIKNMFEIVNKMPDSTKKQTLLEDLKNISHK